jgi:hypothetical protein
MTCIINGRNRGLDQINAYDINTRRPSIVSEVKNRKYLPYTRQLKGDMALVGPNGKVNVSCTLSVAKPGRTEQRH